MKQALQDGFGDPGASYTRFRKQTVKKPEAFDLDFQIQLPQSTRRMLYALMGLCEAVASSPTAGRLGIALIALLWVVTAHGLAVSRGRSSLAAVHAPADFAARSRDRARVAARTVARARRRAP
jgi:hypothetical protein